MSYNRKHGVPGRRYAEGASLQRLSRSLRAAALRSDYETFDVDMTNAFPTLLWNELRDLVGDAVDIEFQIFTTYVKETATRVPQCLPP